VKWGRTRAGQRAEVEVSKAKGLPGDYDRFQKELRKMIAGAPWDRLVKGTEECSL
jgi:hypothetical protein